MMKRLLLLLLTSVLLVACGTEEDNDAKEEKSPTEESEEIEVSIEVEPVMNNGKVSFEGSTNLPDHGELMFTVTDSDEFNAQTKESIIDGKFKTEEFSSKGDPLPIGEYSLTISLSIPSTQDDKFTEVTGEEYENLTGDLMNDGEIGKTMNYETTFETE